MSLRGLHLTGIILLILGFCTTTYGQANEKQHQQFIQKKYRLNDDDIRETQLSHQHTSSQSGVTHAYYQQFINGIAVENACADVHTKNGQLIGINSSFIKNIAQKITGKENINAKAALTKSLEHLDIELPSLPKIQQRHNDKQQKTIFEHQNISLEPITAQLVYYAKFKDNFRLAWKVDFYELDGQHWWEMYIDAERNEVLHTRDRVLHCSFDVPHSGHSSHEKNPHLHDTHECKHHLATPNAAPSTVFDGSSYNVFPLGIESPNHGSRTIVNEPADPIASPFGWHDTNGIPGAEHVITLGNNVHAYEDIDGDNTTIGASPDGTSSLDFDNTYTANQYAIINLDAATTNLFYWNNLMHDIWYHHGFDEVSGNYQVNNYGNGGIANDFVEAQVQDGSGINNANFSPGTDGTAGRMQMYVWESVSTRLIVNTPSIYAGSYTAGSATFGPQEYNLTGDVANALDTSSEPSLVCEPIGLAGVTEVYGKIALIDRGNCNFTDKVLNAQNAGAIAVIICNTANSTNPMSGADASINIPTVMIAQDLCTTIRAEIPNLNVTLSKNLNYQNDSSFDNGIISHEYGHGISTRLTGGASNSACLYNDEQAGEGWSDWFALVMTVQATDNPDTGRGIGTYAANQSTTGRGIRTYPYSRNMSINPHTYDAIKTTTVPHGVGSVWCAMIWDLYWNLIDEHGFDNDMYYGTGGNNIAMHLIMEGLKLQPCSPGFVDSRNAILLADQMLYNGENECLIWNTFARRGLGYSAVQGSSLSRSDGSEAFDVPPNIAGATIEKIANKNSVQTKDTLQFTLNIKGSKCIDVTNVSITDVLPPEMTYLAGSASNGGTHNNGTISWSAVPTLNQDQNFQYTYSVVIDSNYIAPNPQILLADDMEAGTGTWQTSNAANLDNWTLSTDSICGGTSWHAQENEGISLAENQYLTTPIFTLGTNTIFSFQHQFNTEANWDGGTVELSADDGISWIDLGPYMTQNGYNDYIKNAPATTAFAGSSNGCIETLIDLSDFAGANVSIRFNFYYDQYVAGDGWYINDVRLTSTPASINTAYLTSDNNTATDNTATEVQSPCLFTNIYALLEGPYDSNTNKMATNLNSNRQLLPGQIPSSNLATATPVGQPYDIAPWNYMGTEGDNLTDYEETVVDWVLLSFRTGIEKSSEVAQAAALLHEDGRVELYDRCILNENINSNSLYIVLEHRNHIGVMTPTPVTISNNTLDYDFRVGDSYTAAAAGFGQKQMPNGKWVLYAADMDKFDTPSYDINGQDKNIWTANNGYFDSYIPADTNLDGDINGADKNLWSGNNGISSRVPK